MNPNDVTRDAILRHLHAVHEKAKSPRSAAVKISELQKALRPLGLKQQDVGSNLDYLVQKGWVREDIVSRTFTSTPRSPRSSRRPAARSLAPL